MNKPIRMTPLRFAALESIAGEADVFVSPGVARPLERAGLIVWMGWRPGLPTSMKMSGKGWTITPQGPGPPRRMAKP